MKKTVRTALSSILILLGISSAAIADNTPPIAACKSYLRYSDLGFDSLLSASSSLAKTVAKQLNSCLKANACSAMSDIDHCAATLASRVFSSSFYANNSSKGFNLPNFSSGSSGGLGKSPSMPPTSSMATKKTEPTAPPQTTQTPAANAHNTTSSSINWY